MSIQEKLTIRKEKQHLRPLAIGFHPTMIKRLDKIAENHKVSRSELVRMLVDESLSRLDAEKSQGGGE